MAVTSCVGLRRPPPAFHYNSDSQYCAWRRSLVGFDNGPSKLGFGFPEHGEAALSVKVLGIVRTLQTWLVSVRLGLVFVLRSAFCVLLSSFFCSPSSFFVILSPLFRDYSCVCVSCFFVLRSSFLVLLSSLDFISSSFFLCRSLFVLRH